MGLKERAIQKQFKEEKMDNLVIMKNQQAVTTSLQVAATFNK
ncbi:phage regulatory protein, partial [Enterococcus faecalis]